MIGCCLAATEQCVSCTFALSLCSSKLSSYMCNSKRPETPGARPTSKQGLHLCCVTPLKDELRPCELLRRDFVEDERVVPFARPCVRVPALAARPAAELLAWRTFTGPLAQVVVDTTCGQRDELRRFAVACQVLALGSKYRLLPGPLLDIPGPRAAAPSEGHCQCWLSCLQRCASETTKAAFS